MRPRSLTFAAVAIATVATAVVVAAPRHDWAIDRPALRAALETAAAIAALLGAYLVLGAFLNTGRPPGIILFCGLAVLALSNLVFGALPYAFEGRAADAGPQWAAVASQFIGAALVGAAAIAPMRQLRRPARVLACMFAGVVAALAVLTAVGFAVGDSVTPPVRVAPGSARNLHAHWVVTATSAFALVAYLTAAIGFTRRTERMERRVFSWLGAACVLNAVARIHYLLLPTLYTSWVGVGDVFRVSFYVVLLLGAMWEVRLYWRASAESAVLAERRRIARDLHDGVAQELAFIARLSRRLAAASGDGASAQIVASADRALVDSRRAIAALTRPLDEPFAVVLAQTLEEVAMRLGARLELALDASVSVGGDEREALLRIAGEAVANATRHGRGDVVYVELRNERGPTLRVVDRGVGFDPDEAADRNPYGFGLVSMRERAAAIGAAFRLESAPGRGTEVEVSLN